MSNPLWGNLRDKPQHRSDSSHYSEPHIDETYETAAITGNRQTLIDMAAMGAHHILAMAEPSQKGKSCI